MEPAVEFGRDDQEVGVVDLTELLQGDPARAGLAGRAKGLRQLPALDNGEAILAGKGGYVEEARSGFVIRFGFFGGIGIGDDADQELRKEEAGSRNQHGELGLKG